MKKIILAILVLLVAAGFYVVSHLSGTVKGIIESAGTQALGTAVHVSGLDASLASETASISGLTVANPHGFKDDFLKAKSISATLGGIADKTITIKEIVIDGMVVTYELGPNGTNFDALRKNLKSAPTPEESGKAAEKSNGSKGGGYDIVIEKLRIVHAQVIPAVEGVAKPVNLPEIVVTNIGTKGNPATPVQVAKQVMDHILAVSSGAALKSGLSSLTTGLPAGANVDKAKSELKGLFSK